ncbi:MAG: DNA primase [Gammaproteobacteria bacterium]|nr:DNA primase [Gammaproteobacteria bacterium]MAY02183.1 DNA primase [Gammaproteobacteria bacterium]|tara:strand:+ start:601 stop:2376 length:1776 start_codon:yes stop_codon:yes gene_type:complete
MAGFIPQSFIDDLLARADIVDVIGAKVTLKKTGKNYSGLCPFHQEKSPSFTVEPAKQFYYCFGCGKGGNAVGFVMDFENIDYPQAIELLASSMGLEVPREESSEVKQQRERNIDLYDVLQQAAAYYQQQLRQHPAKSSAIEYLKQRGLSGEIARDFKLGFAPAGWQNLLDNIGTSAEKQKLLLDAGMLIDKSDQQDKSRYDRFRNRIMFPIRDQRGRIIGFGGRVIGDEKPKYLNSPETPVFRKGEELYGLYEARQKVRKLERILIVEGYMDVIALAQHDIHYSVATLGTSTSETHLKRLFKLVAEIVFCFDGDDAGRQAAWRALNEVIPLMEDGLSARFLFLPEGEDPDTQVRKTGSRAFADKIGQATPLAEFFFAYLTAQVEMDTLEGRAKLGKLAMPLIRKFPQGILRQLILDQLAKTTGVDMNTLSQMSGDNPQQAPEHPYAPRAAAETRPPHQAQKAVSRTHKVTHSACMKAVNLILQKPDIVTRVKVNEGLKELGTPDIELLFEVLRLAAKAPKVSTHELLAMVYAKPIGSQLIQLMDKEQITPKTGIEGEFREIVAYLENLLHRLQSQQSLLEAARKKLAEKST